jgi:hypothetical protein
VGIVAAIVVLAVALSYFIDEPLRRSIESRMNARLTGYSVTIGNLAFHPIGLSLTLFDVVFVQDEYPDPPIGRIPRLDASVQWKALLRARVVANFKLIQPALHVNLENIRREAKDPRPVADKGWQEAFEAIYPLKINEFRIVDGQVTYVDVGPFEPLQVTHVNFTADDIRNVRSQPGDYPSPVHLEAVVFDDGTLVADGHADFLAEPHLGVKAVIALDKIGLDYFKPIANRYHVSIKNGRLSARGVAEYAPHFELVELERAVIENVDVEYTHTPAKKDVVSEAAAKTAEKAKEVSNEPGLVLRAKELKLVHSTVGFVNEAVTPPYRAFLTDANLTITGFSNQRTEGTTVAKLTGKFMGSGATVAEASFRPDKVGPDFDVVLRLENTDMRTMNDMLRAHGKFDVTAGNFSLYSEIKVQRDRVEGYVKPLFSGLQVYDPAQDRNKSAFHKLYEKTVQAVSKILKNRPRKEVATVATISGPVENAKASTIQIIAKLIQNAFFRAILPGFDRELIGLGRGGTGSHPS